MASRVILSNFFEEQWTQNHPQYPSGLSRALFPTTFIEIAVYFPCECKTYFTAGLAPSSSNDNTMSVREERDATWRSVSPPSPKQPFIASNNLLEDMSQALPSRSASVVSSTRVLLWQSEIELVLVSSSPLRTSPFNSCIFKSVYSLLSDSLPHCLTLTSNRQDSLPWTCKLLSKSLPVPSNFDHFLSHFLVAHSCRNYHSLNFHLL